MDHDPSGMPTDGEHENEERRQIEAEVEKRYKAREEIYRREMTEKLAQELVKIRKEQDQQMEEFMLGLQATATLPQGCEQGGRAQEPSLPEQSTQKRSLPAAQSASVNTGAAAVSTSIGIQADVEKEAVNEKTGGAAQGRRHFFSENEPRRDLNVNLKPRAHPWKEGDNYFIWKSLLLLDLEGRDLLFLVRDGVEPRLNYTEKEIAMMKSLVTAYLISNVPESYQRVLIDCHSPKEVLEELDKAVAPPSRIEYFQLQIAFMNMVYDPAVESLMEFRGRVYEMIKQIRNCPNAELSDESIKLNVLLAISGACPEVYREAIKGNWSLSEIFNQIAATKDTRSETQRRARAAQLRALMGLSSNSDETGLQVDSRRTGQARKRKIPRGKPTDGRWDPSTCQKCGRVGHWRKNCNYKDKVCFNCHRPGHWARDCDQPRIEGKPQPPVKRQKTNEPQGSRKQYPSRRQKSKPGASSRGSAQTAQLPDKEVGRETAAIVTRKREVSSDSDAISLETTLSVEGKNANLNMIADSGATEHMVNDSSVFTVLRNLEKPVTIICANSNKSADMTIRQSGDIVCFNEETKKYGILTDVLYAPGLFENLFSIRKQVQRGLVARFSDSAVELVSQSSARLVKRGSSDGRFWWLGFHLPLQNAPLEVRKKVIHNLRQNLGTAVQAMAESDPSTSNIGQNSDNSAQGTRRKRRHENSDPSESEASDSELVENRSKRPKSQDVELGGRKPVGTGGESLRDNSGLKWHYRLNHASHKYLEIAGKAVPELKGVKFGKDILDCSDCRMAKAKKQPCSAERHRASQTFQLLYSDLMGPLRPVGFSAGKNAARYIVTYTDDASRYAFAYDMADKTGVSLSLEQCLKDIRKLTGSTTKVAELRTDGGLEYQTSEMQSLLRQEGISHTVCEPYTPQHNGPAERLNLELQEKVRVNLISSGIPTFLWPSTMRHVIHVHNRLPNASINFHSPFEIVMGRKPNLSYLKRYGCEAFMTDTRAKNLPKFAPRATRCFLVECYETGYALYHPVNRTIVRTKHVTFVEDRTYADYLRTATEPVPELSPQVDQGIVKETQQDEERTQLRVDEVGDNSEQPCPSTSQGQDEMVGNDPSTEIVKTQTKVGETSEYEIYKEGVKTQKKIGETKECDFYEEDEDAQLTMLLKTTIKESSENNDEPGTYQEAMESSNAAKWQEAINQEFNAIETCSTWKIVPRSSVPAGTRILKTRWVHKIKTEANGSERFRSRLVVKGFADSNQYDPSSSKTLSTPMIADYQTCKRPENNEPENSWNREEIPYRQVIGALLYFQNGTRPDIAYAVNVLSRRQSDFQKEDWLAVIRVLRYLRGTRTHGIRFTPGPETINCFVDASLGMNAELGHSTTGFIIYLYGCPVVWRSKKQNHVALSSAEAEFVAMSSACRELASLRTLCEEILAVKLVPALYEDSRPAIRLAEVDESSALKHLVRLSYLYVREEHKRGNITIEWIGTDQQIADLFTKPLPKNKFVYFRDKIMSKL